MLEKFVIKSPNAVEQNENLLSWGNNQRHVYYHNSSVSNDTKVLVIGDSYFRDYIIDDIAESFSDTIMVWSDTIPNFTSLIDDFQPDIVIFESAERCDNTGIMIRMAEAL